jgi:hypothetical protein
MKLLRIFGWVILGFALLLTVLLASIFTFVDNTPYTQLPYYQQTKDNISQLKSLETFSDTTTLVGWEKVNFTPTSPSPTAGYGAREGKPYKSIHDSVYVRALVLKSKAATSILLSADLLIIPPLVYELLGQKLKTIGLSTDQVYFGATHTHNSVGAWNPGYPGEMFGGKFNPKMVEHIADCMFRSIQNALSDVSPAQIGYGQMYLADMMYNRLVGGKGTIDPFVRVIKIEKDNGQKAIFCTYAAHATTLDDDKLILSRDYPGVLVDSLEHHSANFAMFMAGAVGSMGPLDQAKDDFEQMRNEALGIQIEIEKNLDRIKVEPKLVANTIKVDLGLREPHARVSESIRFRPWVFYKLFGNFKSNIKVTKIGNTVLIGLPCDFSGEFMADLCQFAEKQGKHLIVTSFNGGYIGYITPDKYYQLNEYETRVMNWFGPQNGAYFSEMIKDVISKI